MRKISPHSTRRISKNSLFLLIARFIDILARLFIIIPVVARYLGVEQYGDYGYVMIFAFIAASVSYVGVERIIIREVSKDPGRAGYYLGGGLIVRWLYMAVATAFVIIFVQLMDLSPEITLGIYIATLAFNFNAETFIYLAVFKAFEKMHYETYLTLLFQLLNVVFIVLVSRFNLGFTSLFIGFLIANILRTSVVIMITRKKSVMPNLRVNLSLIKFLVRESWVLGLFVLGLQGFINADMIVLKTLKTTFDVSMFYAPHNLIILLNIVSVSLMTGLFPAFSRSAQKDSEGLLYKYEKTFKVFVALSMFMATVFMALPHKLILIFYSKEFLPAVLSFRILSMSIVFTMLFVVFDFVLVAIKRQNILILCPLIGLAVKIIFNLLLIPKYAYVGATIAASIGYLVFFSSGFFLVSKYVGILPIHRIVLKPALAAGLIGICLYKFDQGNIYLLIPLSFAVYGFCLFKLKFFLPDEILMFKSITQKITGVASGR